MAIRFAINDTISVDQFIDLLRRSTLDRRRPIGDRGCIEGMLRYGNLLVTARDGDRLVGVARSVTDFCYVCFLSELAVDVDYQRRGIGRELLARTRRRLGPRCTLRLVSAPDAAGYYPAMGFARNTRCWELGPRGDGEGLGSETPAQE